VNRFRIFHDANGVSLVTLHSCVAGSCVRKGRRRMTEPAAREAHEAIYLQVPGVRTVAFATSVLPPSVVPTIAVTLPVTSSIVTTSTVLSSWLI